MTTVRVLYVEDNSDDFEIVSGELCPRRQARSDLNVVFNLTWSETLGEALDVLRTSSIDIVLLDYSLPDTNGVEAIGQIQKVAPQLPIVVLTGMNREELAMQALKSGAQDYLVKGEALPFLAKTLLFALERNQIVLQLEEARREAQSATDAKSAFLANMSHEIRTPLTAIIGFADALEQSEMDLAERRFAVEAISRNGQHLLDLINDILDLSKIEAGKLDIELRSFTVVGLMRELEVPFRFKTEEKGLSFSIDYKTEIPSSIITDPRRLKQVLFNVIGNAVKFTADGGVTVEVACSSEAKELKFTVIDSGLGMSEEVQKCLFKPFSQGDVSTTRRFGGTGLGLAITKELVDRLGGEITIESAEGQGTKVFVTVCTGSLESVEMISADCARDEHASGFAEEEADLSPLPRVSSILVAEDSPDTSALIKYMLNRVGMRAQFVDNGLLALKLSKTENFDLLMLDMHMPGMGGLDVASNLRASGYQGKILALTADAMKGIRERCLMAGCDAYLAKPFAWGDLYRAISKLVGQASSDPGPQKNGTVISELLEDEPEFAPVVVGFIGNLANRVTEMNEALNTANWDHLRTCAHRLKGAAATYGYPELSKSAAALEDHASKGDRELLLRLVDELGALCFSVEKTKPEVEKLAASF